MHRLGGFWLDWCFDSGRGLRLAAFFSSRALGLQGPFGCTRGLADDDHLRFAGGWSGEGDGGAGEFDGEGGADARILRGPDGAAVLLHDGAADGEAEAGAAFLAGVGEVDLVEAL